MGDTRYGSDLELATGIRFFSHVTVGFRRVDSNLALSQINKPLLLEELKRLKAYAVIVGYLWIH